MGQRVSKSIIQERKECYFCGKVLDLELHHCIHGTANRRLADEDGLTVWLCFDHHRGRFGVHSDNVEKDNLLKRVAERAYLRYYKKTVDDFIKRYGKNYL